jgi:pyrroline-5-carboxylate reductase
MKVGFAGAGNMAAALARGWAEHGGPDGMLFSDSGSGRSAELAGQVGGERRESVAEVAGECDLLVLAVKPAALEEVATAIAGFEGPAISVLGATGLDRLTAALPRAAWLRTMPNVAVEVGRGVICHAPASEPDRLENALELLGRIGTLVELPEAQLDAATAVMGCSPAYLAIACEALIGAGGRAGLEPDLARRLVTLTAAGTGDLMLVRDPAEIQVTVASPGGSTEAGLEALRERGAPESFAAAVEASLERMAGKR